MSGKIKLMVLVLVASLCVAACSRDKEKAKQTAPPAETVNRQVIPPPPPEIIPVTGKVLEILDTSGFVYVLLDWNGQQIWATVPGVDLKVGEVISLDSATMIDKGFHSTALNRNFDKMIMASGVTGKAARSRASNTYNPKDPKSRRSGKLMAGISPAPPRPTGKVAGKAGQ
jgi:hypothetical protein